MKNSLFIILFLCIIGSCKRTKGAPEQKQRTLFSYLGDNQFLIELGNKHHWEKEKNRAKKDFLEAPIISQEEVALWQPLLKKWLDYYHLDLSQARLTYQHKDSLLNAGEDKQSIYYHPFTKKDDTPDDLCNLYSPNRMRYVNEYRGCDITDNTLEFYGDDSQNINLTDRKLRHHTMILFLGSLEHSDDVFWKDNDVFAIVGYSEVTLNTYKIWLFDLKNTLRKEYTLPDEGYLPQGIYPSHIIEKAKARNIRTPNE